MQQKLIDLSTQYVQAGSAILDAIRDIIKDAGGFIYQTILSITRNIDEYLGSASLSH